MARPARRPGNLPAIASSFVGRRRELSDVRRLLGDTRLLSLIGQGGVGKSRLAIQAASGVARVYPAGVWMVQLADVRDPGLVEGAAIAALDLRAQAATEPREVLLSHLRDQQALLILDNCEHLLTAVAPLVAEVLHHAPGVRVIATSRQPLSVPGEHVLRVPPLRLPPREAVPPLAQLGQNEAVSLFVARADAASGGFGLTEDNRSAVAELCHRLDGLPLAIELAAVRTRVLTAEQILDRLIDRFGLLTGGARVALPRHQTLRATIEWSYDLLDPVEQVLLQQLCVFAGRFTLEDAEAVGKPRADPLDLLTSLVEKSLVVKEDVGAIACYRLHETMREYAALRLREAGEEDAARERCAEHYRSRCREAAPATRYRLPEWLAWMDVEIDNVRVVLRRSIDGGDIERGLELATSLGWWWITRAAGEGVRWLDELLALRPGPAVAYYVRGFLAILQSDSAAGRPALQRAAAAARAAGDESLYSQSVSMASIAAHMAGDRAAAHRLRDEAAPASDDYPATVTALQARALAGLADGDFDEVVTVAGEGVRISRAAGDLYSLGMMLLNRGTALLARGDHEGCRQPLIEALRIAARVDDRIAQYALLDVLGCRAAGTGDESLAARLLGAAETVRTGVGADVQPFLVPLLSRVESAVADHRAAFDAGRRLSRSEAIRLALGEPDRRATAAANGVQLRKREAQVAVLIAEGLSNREIGARLFISEHTVDTHVRNALNRLGFHSRAQIAAWVAVPDED